MLKVIISGVSGRMGSRIFNLAKEDKEIKVIAGLERKDHPEIGKEFFPGVKLYSSLEEVISSTEVIVEFTNPQATLEHLSLAGQKKKAMVIGTTGFSEKEVEKIKEISQSVPIVFSPNMSIGVNLLFRLVREVAKVVPDYDIEIIEAHHNQKKDAPSGTALKLAKIISEELNRDLNKVAVYGREGLVGARKKEEIGILAVRAGDIVGEHTVIFATQGERIELIHRAHSRDTFAAGAIRAAKWIVKQRPGLYDMQNVLGLPR